MLTFDRHKLDVKFPIYFGLIALIKIGAFLCLPNKHKRDETDQIKSLFVVFELIFHCCMETKSGERAEVFECDGESFRIVLRKFMDFYQVKTKSNNAHQ